LSRKITEEAHTTESKTCAGFTMRDSALLQQLPCNTGAQRRSNKICACPTEKRKNRIRRKIKYAPDLQHAGACLYNNFLAPPAHNGSSAKLRLFHRKAEEPQTTESKVCAGLQGRACALRSNGATAEPRKADCKNRLRPSLKFLFGGK